MPFGAWAALFAPALPPLLLHGVRWQLVLLVQLTLGAWLVMVGSHVVALVEKWDRKVAGPYLFLASLGLVAGLPLGLSIIGDWIAAASGCFVHDHGALTWSEDRSPHLSACSVGRFEAGPLLDFIHMARTGIVLTWPHTVAALFLASLTIFRWFNDARRRAQR